MFSFCEIIFVATCRRVTFALCFPKEKKKGKENVAEADHHPFHPHHLLVLHPLLLPHHIRHQGRHLQVAEVS